MPPPARGFRRRRSRAGLILAVSCIFGLMFVQACSKTGSPSSPNSPGDLTGQNTNVAATFDGTITVIGGGSAPADNTTDAVLIAEVLDALGNPVANGTPVNFTTNLGTVRALNTAPGDATSAVQVIAFEGRAQVAVRSGVAGDATITVSVADVALAVRVRFTAIATEIFISLAIRSGTGDSETTQTTAPSDVTLVSTVTDAQSQGLPGRSVRFTMASDTTGASGHGPATFLGPRKTNTNNVGEAFNVVSIKGEGTVTLVVELLDGDTNTVIGRSNQAIVTTTSVVPQVAVSLTFDNGSTFQQTVAPDTKGIRAIVTATGTGTPLVGRRVEFVISGDNSVTDKAELANSGGQFTDSTGRATNAISVYEAAVTVTIVAQVLTADGRLEAESNQITITTTDVQVAAAVTLEFEDGGFFAELTVPGSTGLKATVKGLQSGQPLAGRTVRFRITSDTALVVADKAVLSSTEPSQTNEDGEATNAVTATEAGTTVTIVAELLDDDGTVTATSNQITVATK